MEDCKCAVVGIGATGTVLAAALLSRNPETVLLDPMPGLGDKLIKSGIKVTGVISYDVPVKHFLSDIKDLKDINPDIIFISTKTFHLKTVLDSLYGGQIYS